MSTLSILDWVVLLLVVIGGINWGLVGVFHFNLVGFLVGDMTTAARIIYGLVGLAAIYLFLVSTKIISKIA